MTRCALVVGISDYQSPTRHLSRTATDAQAVAQVLAQSDLFQEITLLTGTVTGNQLGKALQQLLLQQATNNEALIYFTGHGMTATGYLQQQSGYLVTTDSAVEWQEHQVIEVRRGISLSDFNQLILGSNLNSLIVLLDCCHSGYFLERHCLVERLTAFSASKDYYFITACGSFEETSARPREPHSVFTGALLKALSPDNADEMGLISGDRLFDCLSRDLKKSGLEPLHLGWGQAITVVKYPVAPPAPTPIPLVRRENPYVGLAAFDMTQADYFYGRERAVRDLLDRLTKGRFLVVYGPSGCGKSSLIKAGLLPELQGDRLPGSREWDLECCTPGQAPVPTLEEILIRQHQRHQPFALFVDQFEELFTLCHEETQQRQFIHRLSEEAVNNPNARILVAIRGDFLDRCTQFPEVVKLINSTDPPSTYLVTPLTLAELEEAIEQPAARHGVTYEPGLVSQIAEDVAGQPGELPLLQYALTELWKQCIEKGDKQQLTQEGYGAIGRVQGALQQRADQLYSDKEIFSDADRNFVRRLMIELVQLGEAQEVSRRRVEWEQLRALADSPEQLERVVKQLADERLIVTNDKTVEVAHEALLTEWPLFRHLIEQNREAIRLRRHLENDCQDWQEKGRSEDYLLSAGRLAAIEEWLKRDTPRLPGMQIEFVRKSQEKRDRGIQKELENERKLRVMAEARQQEAEQRERLEKQRQRLVLRSWLLFVGFLSAFSLATLTFRVVRLDRQKNVELQTQLAEKYFKTSEQAEALKVSVQALDSLKKSSLRLDNYLKALFQKENLAIDYLKRLQSIIYGIQEVNRWEGDSIAVTAITINHGIKNNSFDSPAIASIGVDRHIKLYNLKGIIIKSFPKVDYLWNPVFSHNGKLLASVEKSGKVRLWNVETGKIERIFSGHKGESYSVEFSPDDRLIASSGSDGKVKIWSSHKYAAGGLEKSLAAFSFLDKKNQKQNYLIYGLSFYPKKNRNIIAFGGKGDYGVRIWDLEQKFPRLIGKHHSTILQAKFSPDGRYLATSSVDGVINIWSVQPLEKARLVAEIQGHESEIWALDFSGDSQYLVSGSSDKTVKVWDINESIKLYGEKQKGKFSGPITETGSISKLLGHTATVSGVGFVFFNQVNRSLFDNNKLIVSASDDRTIRLWEWQHKTISNTNNAEIDHLLQYGCSRLNAYTQNSLLNQQHLESVCEEPSHSSP